MDPCVDIEWGSSENGSVQSTDLELAQQNARHKQGELGVQGECGYRVCWAKRPGPVRSCTVFGRDGTACH